MGSRIITTKIRKMSVNNRLSTDVREIQLPSFQFRSNVIRCYVGVNVMFKILYVFFGGWKKIYMKMMYARRLNLKFHLIMTSFIVVVRSVLSLKQKISIINRF